VKPERCKCGKYELERWCGTYGDHLGTHRRDGCKVDAAERLFSDTEVARIVAKAPPWDNGPDTTAFERLAIDLRNERTAAVESAKLNAETIAAQQAAIRELEGEIAEIRRHQPECSICRSRHGREITHACE
jgi:hypothetical protein